MDSKILLGKILQRLEDIGYAKVDGYNKFELVNQTNTFITMRRENGNEVNIPFKRIIDGIHFYKNEPNTYDETPTSLRRIPMTHITSPIFALLHLISKENYF